MNWLNVLDLFGCFQMAEFSTHRDWQSGSNDYDSTFPNVLSQGSFFCGKKFTLCFGQNVTSSKALKLL